MKIAPILNPDVCRPAPKPIRVDLRKVFQVVTGLWLVALVMCAILLLCGFHMLNMVILCGSGVAIGAALLVWEYFDRWDYRRLGA